MYISRTNPMAIASLIAGALSWLVFPVMGSIIAVITGHIALRQIRSWGGEEGQGLAYCGLALGYINILAFLVLLFMVGSIIGLAGLLIAHGG